MNTISKPRGKLGFRLYIHNLSIGEEKAGDNYE